MVLDMLCHPMVNLPCCLLFFSWQFYCQNFNEMTNITLCLEGINTALEFTLLTKETTIYAH